jgi:ATP-dependent Clp protease protease subunit
MDAAPPPLGPRVVHATFAGPIDQASVQRIFTGFGIALGSGVQSIHLLFQSAGGMVGDGVALYNYFKSLPVDLHLYNAGTVASIATIAFLGAKQRYAAASATFMIHKTRFAPGAGTNAAQLRAMAEMADIDDTRTRAILQDHLVLPENRLNEHLDSEVPFTAAAALECGLVTAIEDFSPPPGGQLFNV